MQRLNCEKYPCHFPNQDCAFCFCPFYPCMDSRTKGRYDGDVWSCQDCTLIHNDEVSVIIMDDLMNGGDISAAWKKLERFL